MTAPAPQNKITTWEGLRDSVLKVNPNTKKISFSALGAISGSEGQVSWGERTENTIGGVGFDVASVSSSGVKELLYLVDPSSVQLNGKNFAFEYQTPVLKVSRDGNFVVENFGEATRPEKVNASYTGLAYGAVIRGAGADAVDVVADMSATVSLQNGQGEMLLNLSNSHVFGDPIAAEPSRMAAGLESSEDYGPATSSYRRGDPPPLSRIIAATQGESSSQVRRIFQADEFLATESDLASKLDVTNERLQWDNAKGGFFSDSANAYLYGPNGEEIGGTVHRQLDDDTTYDATFGGKQVTQ